MMGLSSMTAGRCSTISGFNQPRRLAFQCKSRVVCSSSVAARELPDSEYKIQGQEPKPYQVAKGQLVSIITSAASPIVRLGSGAFTYGYKMGTEKLDKSHYSVARAGGYQLAESSKISTLNRPKEFLQLYEFEGCPFCKKVREAVSILDLDVTFFPSPRDSPVNRAKAIKLGGKAQFPFLVDPNTGTQMYESDDIIAYLYTTYGPGIEARPLMLKPNILTTISCGLALAGRLGKGSKFAKGSKAAAAPLRVWAYEASPFCKVVREVLNELELPHTLLSVARGSPKRQELFEKRGHFQAPFLEDPNTGIAMFESVDIIAYLRKTYGA